MEVIIVTGMSGAGRTKASVWLEDQGYYCIDNMPPQLIRNFLEISMTTNMQKVAFVADVRGGAFFQELERVIDNLREREDIKLTVLYIDCSTQELIRRFNETRRAHPLSGGRATQAVIEEERQRLEGLRKKADRIIDTTGMKVAEFYTTLVRTFLNREDVIFNINISSFGFKYGLPIETDFVCDVRFLPNPYYIKSLRPLTGNNKKIQDYVFRSPLAQKFVTDFHSMIHDLIHGYMQEGKYHLNIAFGCTGGHHRSVAIANAMAKLFREDGYRVTLTHRDLAGSPKGDSRK